MEKKQFDDDDDDDDDVAHAQVMNYILTVNVVLHILTPTHHRSTMRDSL